MVEKEVKISVIISPEELAKEFAEMEATEQARFFNQVARIADSWRHSFVFQLSAVGHSGVLTQRARALMRDIGDYAEEGE